MRSFPVGVPSVLVCVLLCFAGLRAWSRDNTLRVAPFPHAWPAAHSYMAAAREKSIAEALAGAQADARALPVGAAPECAAWLTSNTLQPTFVSQVGQDATIYYSFLAGKLARGERGFYVDVGANDPRVISNTWFLDRCLGWRGICFEADMALAANLKRSERTCTVINKCASDRVGEIPYVNAGVNGHVARPGETANAIVPCAPLSELLRTEGVTSVDFLSIDIEGNEVTALSNSDWDAVPIQLLLVETAWSSELLDMLLSDAGFWRISDLAYGDDLYIRGPRLLHNTMQASHRKGNWEWIVAKEKEKGRCLKREGNVTVDGAKKKNGFQGMGGFTIF